jgi:predicted RNA-binding Zn-ribbon protein involved in translation (DUF1610 family)
MEFRYGDPVHDPTTAPKKTTKPAFHPQCLTCGYDLRGLTSGRCPECGNVFVHRDWEHAVRDAKDAIAEVEQLLAWVPWAWKVVVFGIAVFLTALIPGMSPGWRLFVRITGLLSGALGFLFAVNVLRVRQVPTWARSHLEIQPDYSSALVGFLGGVALVLAAIFLP